MKKTILSLSLLLTITISYTQTIADAVKLIHYGKTKSAKDVLQKLQSANASDAAAIYWHGQALIVEGKIDDAKAVYQKALQSGNNSSLLFIGMAHVDLLQGGDWATAQQKFETAISTSVETRGKNKGKAPIDIYNAIGRANTIGRLVKDGSSKFGNMDFAIEKLKIAKDVDPNNTDCFIYMGLAYRKMGGEFGGEAQKSYMEALSRNPNNPVANYYIGKIYQSQQNKPAMEQYFNAALQNDVAFAPAYLEYYKYYANRDVSVAKANIEKYLQYSDKDCNNDFLYADYLFQAGNFNESLAKAKELENTECSKRVNVLYAYNYDRLNDSVQAKSYIEKFITATAPSDILQNDYEIAAKILSRFPGSENQAIGYLNKILDRVIENDGGKNAQIDVLSRISDVQGKAKNYSDQISTIKKIIALRGTTSELDYYKMSVAAQNSKDFNQGLEIARSYITAFPDKPQPYTFFKKSALGLDPDTSKGTALPLLEELNNILIKDTAKNKKTLFSNYYYALIYYGDKAKDYAKGIEMLDKMLFIYPNTGEENKFANEQKVNFQKMLANPPKPTKATQTPASPASGNPKTPKTSTKSTGSIKAQVKESDKSSKKK